VNLFVKIEASNPLEDPLLRWLTDIAERDRDRKTY
jgi:hypothetical protein